jgi:uncharacterized protein (TIGR02118 family)
MTNAMTKVSILYPNRDGGRFDANYYFNQHMPLAIRLLGPALRGATAEQGIGGASPGQPPPYIAACHFLFDSPEAFFEAFTPHAETLRGDIPVYTDIEPIIQISEVRISR